MNYFVTAIGTDSGKTLVSAILCEALHADYWKPVQAGTPGDTATVRSLVSNTRSVFHEEQYVLRTPASPHAAARVDGVSIELESFRAPRTTNRLIVEGAGGCLVPLNDDSLIADLIARLDFPAIVVSNFYLGSINHTLLTIEALKSRRIPIKGIVFNGQRNEETERIVLHRTGLPNLLRIDHESEINRAVVNKYAAMLNENWND